MQQTFAEGGSTTLVAQHISHGRRVHHNSYSIIKARISASP